MKKPTKDIGTYVQDIHDAVERIGEYIAEGELVFLNDRKTQDAVIRQLAIIGEAASSLPERVKTQYPDIPWSKVVGMRHILVHHYAGVNMRRVWETVERDLPPLRRTVERMLEEWKEAAA